MRTSNRYHRSPFSLRALFGLHSEPTYTRKHHSHRSSRRAHRSHTPRTAPAPSVYYTYPSTGYSNRYPQGNILLFDIPSRKANKNKITTTHLKHPAKQSIHTLPHHLINLTATTTPNPTAQSVPAAPTLTASPQNLNTKSTPPSTPFPPPV
jgi:hypothetical protein